MTYYINVSIYLSAVLTALIIILNSVVVWIIGRRKKLTRLYSYLLNLAFADLATGLLDVLPRTIERANNFVYLQNLTVAVHFCKLQRCLGHVALVTSNFILAAMSIDRAEVVINPMRRFKRGRLIQLGAVLACWIVGFLCSIPITVLNDIKDGKCITFIVEDPSFWWQLYFTYDLVVQFILPLIIITVSYTLLLVGIHRRGIPSPGSPESGGRTFNRRLPRSKLRSIKLTFGIIMSFVVCWTPYMLTSALQVFSKITFCCMVIITCLRYLNSVANPIMFFIFHYKKQAEVAGRTPSSETLQFFLASMREKLKWNGSGSEKSVESSRQNNDIQRQHIINQQQNKTYGSDNQILTPLI